MVQKRTDSEATTDIFPDKQQASSIVTNNSNIPLRQDIFDIRMCFDIVQRTMLPKLSSMNMKKLQLLIDRVNGVIAGIPLIVWRLLLPWFMQQLSLFVMLCGLNLVLLLTGDVLHRRCDYYRSCQSCIKN